MGDMPLHKNAIEHFEKINRVYAKLDKVWHRDDFDDFFKSAYHILEITERDPPHF